METPLKVRVLNGHWIHPPVPNSTIVDTHRVALAPSMDVRGVNLSIDAWMSRTRSSTHTRPVKASWSNLKKTVLSLSRRSHLWMAI